MCHKNFVNAAQLEEYLSNPLNKQIYNILFVDWTSNVVYLQTVDFVKASALMVIEGGGNGKQQQEVKE